MRGDVTAPAPPRAFSPSVSDPRCSSFCWCFLPQLPPPPPKLPRRIPPRASPGANRTAGRETSCRAHAPPGASAGDGARGPRRCPAAAAPAPERRRAAGCNDYPMDARVGREGRNTLTYERLCAEPLLGTGLNAFIIISKKKKKHAFGHMHSLPEYD